jgi:NAD(P)-dependent dehydrogenase (short-subunit alcohol dehydrogenase family)
MFQSRTTAVKLDVTSSDSVAAAAVETEKLLKAKKLKLVGIINCAGVAFEGSYVF